MQEVRPQLILRKIKMATKQDVENLKQEYIDSEFGRPYACFYNLSLGNRANGLMGPVLNELDAIEEAITETGNMPTFSERHRGNFSELTLALKAFRENDRSDEMIKSKSRKKKEFMDNINLYDQIKIQMLED